MKLRDCEVFVVGNPPPRKGGRYFIFVKLTTDDGITGIGEVYAATFGPHVVADMVRDVFGRHFEGADPHRIEHLWRVTYGSGYTGRPDASLIGVLSGREGDTNPHGLMLKNACMTGIFVGSRMMFEQMNEAISINQMHPVVDRVFPCEEAAEAYGYQLSGSHFGKVVIKVSQ